LLIISEPNYKLYNSVLWRIRSSHRLRKIFSSIGLKRKTPALPFALPLKES